MANKANKWWVAGPNEIKMNVRDLALDEISTVVYEWDGVPADHKIATIEGILALVAALDEDLRGLDDQGRALKEALKDV